MIKEDNGFWRCTNCSAEYEPEDMNYEEMCEVCADEDDQYHCEWIKTNDNVKVNLDDFESYIKKCKKKFETSNDEIDKKFKAILFMCILDTIKKYREEREAEIEKK